jgi:hypothetical protein
MYIGEPARLPASISRRPPDSSTLDSFAINMSSNKFAHWNRFPFATVRKRSQQTQSLLFRLPRELRDLIYEHYAHEETGYEYHYASGKMMHRRAEPPDVIRLSLALTCRRVAEEIKNVGWQANTIHFSPLLSVDDGTDYLGERSRAARFKNRKFHYSPRP